jgi:uncharacterized repeat protein (TIGR01451 family)
MSVAPGATLVYTIRYANIGSGPATGVVVTETVPGSTRFNRTASSPGWSCADGSPPGTPCTHAVPDLAPGGQGSLLFAVVVDSTPASRVIRNSVRIVDAEGGSSGGNDSTLVPAPAPALAGWALSVALAMLAAVARRHLSRRR